MTRRLWKWRAGSAAALMVLAGLAVPDPASAASSVRTGMTWTVLGQQGDSVRVGADSQTNPYTGDTTVDQPRAILCLLVDGRAKPPDVVTGPYNGWAAGAVQVTPQIPGLVLTSQAQGDTICAETFGTGWRLAEFHDGGGWSFWASGSIPPGTRFWTAINDQPANPWDSAGDMPASVAQPKFLTSEAPVPGQFIAMLPESTSPDDVAGIANSLVATYGGTIIDTMESGMFSFTASDAQAQAMSLDSRVESVEQDTYGQPSEYSWAIDRVDQRNLPLDGAPYTGGGATGAGVKIYILDTGFRPSHQEFGGRASQAVDFIRFFGQRDDCNGHGTAVGSVAGGATVGVAPGATLISVRIAGCRGNAYNPFVSVFNSTIVAGLNWVANHHSGPSVANVSYGVPPGFWRRWLRLSSPTDRAAKFAISRGVTVVAAAGNENRSADKSSPARAGGVISVSATDRFDTRTSWGNYGKVDMFAPGDGVRAAWLDADNQYAYVNGTSFSSPLVAGAAALYLQSHPSASPSAVASALYANATPNKVINPGPGSANRLLFVGAPPATHAGMTWARLTQRSDGIVQVGRDATTNAYTGDTPASAALPVLCIYVDGRPAPAGIPTTGFGRWAGGAVAATPAIPGAQLTSVAAANAICSTQFGSGWRMAEFHDGGGWSLWASGNLPASRFWTSINDQPANPWN
ncbi:S8 family peptidase [Dactylosporangium sp. NPDC048998]|uniref:S8 family peptidase n=1 Tax=Dactylosporangium sp. NPDC048998 TaxID=3363976 RepID=UPI003712D092